MGHIFKIAETMTVSYWAKERGLIEGSFIFCQTQPKVLSYWVFCCEAPRNETLMEVN